jgi:hypothetical protein
MGVSTSAETCKMTVNLSNKTQENPMGHNSVVLENPVKKEYVHVDTYVNEYESLTENKVKTLTGENKVNFTTTVEVSNKQPSVSSQSKVEVAITEHEYEKAKQTASSMRGQVQQWHSSNNCTTPVRTIIRATGYDFMGSSGSVFNTPTGTLVRTAFIKASRTRCVVQ